MRGVNLIGYTKRKLGIGEAFKLNIKAFEITNVPFNVYDIETTECVNENIKDNYCDVNLFQISPLNVLTIGMNFDKKFYERKYNILFAAWESEFLPKEARENLSFFDEIWSPSKFCQSILSRYFSGSVINVPHPVYIKVNENNANFEFTDIFDRGRVSFLNIFDYNSSIERKNILGLLDSFESAFGKTNHTIELILKTSNAKRNRKEVQKIEEKIKGISYIKKIDEYLSRENLNYLISECDSYVSLHRSEGFGLTMAEAMFFEKPVIGTGYSGNLEFMNSFNSFLVDFEIVKNTKVDNNYDENIIWANPSNEHASTQLKFVARNYDEAKRIGEKAAIDVKKHFSIEAIGQLINQRLNFIKNESEDFNKINKEKKDILFSLKSELELNKKQLVKMKKNFFIKMILLFIKKL